MRMLIRYWGKRRLVQPLWKSVWRFLKKLEIDLPGDTIISLLVIFPRILYPTTEILTHTLLLLFYL